MASRHLTAIERLERAGGSRDDRVAVQWPAAEPKRRDAVGTFGIYVFGTYLLTKMFYVLKSGAAQPADVLILAMAALLVSPMAIVRFLRAEVALTALILWTILVNAAWFGMVADDSYLPAILYYLFNLLVVVVTFSTRLRNPEAFDRMVPRFVHAAIAIQLAWVMVDQGGLRVDGSFRNPNQLAYWGVCLLSLLMVIRRSRARLWDLPFILAIVYIEFASASRAGLAGTLVLLAIWSYYFLETPTRRFFGLLAAMLLAIIAVASPLLGDLANREAGNTTLVQRDEDYTARGQFEERNYTRIFEYYGYLVTGAGEGGLNRFDEGSEEAIELHSSFGTLLFSYGIPGVALFLVFLVSLFVRVPMNIAVYIVPSLMYGLTHQGLRFSFFWILLGLLLTMATRNPRSARVPVEPLHPTHQRRDSDYLRTLDRRR